MTAGTMRAHHPAWSPVLAGLRADALDCLQSNLAAVADAGHRRGAHLALGAPLRFMLEGRPDGPPTVAATTDRRLAQAGDLLGLRVTGRWDGLDGTGLRELASERGLLYVIADAHAMPWLPYAGRAHLAHSFLLTMTGAACGTAGASRTATVVDAYHNTTEWGEARPGVWGVSAGVLDEAASGGATAVTLAADPLPDMDPEAVLRGNAAALAAGRADVERYLAALRAAAGAAPVADLLVLDVWLLSRERSLHAAWLAALPGRSQQASIAAGHARAWQRLAATTFVAARRVRRGQAGSAAAIDRLGRLLREDVLVAGRLASCAASPGPPAAAAGADHGGLE